jgi:hypothetical protein
VLSIKNSQSKEGSGYCGCMWMISFD